MPVKIKEKDIQKAILEYLAWHKIFAWRVNAGKIIIHSKGKERMINVGMKGVSDIVGILPPDGRMLCIEVKTKTGKLSDSQKEFLDKIKEQGGVAFVARSVDDVIENLKRH